MLYRLVYNIRCHFNELILAWSQVRSHSNLSTALSSFTIINYPFKWVIHSTFLSFQWNSWLSETVSNCLLSHFTPSFLEDHRSFKNWCSGQLFILVYRSGDLTKNQGLVVCLQWPEITYKTITFGITRCFLKTLPAEEWT